MKRTTLVGPGLLVVALLLPACGASDDDSTPSPSTGSSSAAPAVDLNTTPMNAQDTRALDRLVQGVYIAEVQKMYPALWVGVWHPERGAYVAAWGESERGGPPATVDDVFRIGSVTKTFTATVVLQLVDQGKLTLDDTVETAAPQTAQAHPEVAERTIRQLLSMTSGIPDYLNVPNGVVADISTNPQTVWQADDLIDAGIAGGLQKPGTGGYSTTNYILLQEVAEEITGHSLQELIHERILDPLDMSHTALPPNDDTTLPDPATHGYLNPICVAELEGEGATVKIGQDVTDWSASYGQGGGGMHATIADLGIWGATGLGSTLLEDDTARTREKTAPVAEGLNYGLGIGNYADGFLGHSTYGDGFLGHPGEAIGWLTQVAHDADTGVTVAIGTNACAGADTHLFNPIRSLVAHWANTK